MNPGGTQDIPRMDPGYVLRKKDGGLRKRTYEGTSCIKPEHSTKRVKKNAESPCMREGQDQDQDPAQGIDQ
jgi:hypothetical protein